MNILDQWDTYYRANPRESTLTTERFQELSSSLSQIDTNFNALWMQQVLKNYPNLDRVIHLSEK